MGKIEKRYENEIKVLNKKKTLANINILFNARNNATKFIVDYSSRILEVKRLAKQQGTRLKLPTPQQMLQRLSIALAQIKTSNNSTSVLNAIRQTVTLCINQKKLPKKYIVT